MSAENTCSLNITNEFDESMEEFHSHMLHSLMPFKVREVLLVSSFYDAFIIEEEGLISEMVIGEYGHLHLSSPPRFTRVSSGKKALEKAKNKKYDLVITMTKNIGMDPYEFGKQFKETCSPVPVILLATEFSDLEMIDDQQDREGVDKVFFWNGDTTLLMAIIKSVEDKINAPYDIKTANVRLLILLEDSVRDYSLLLPVMYTEIVQQTERSISEDLNEMQRLVRRRARPKIMLAETYEEAMKIYKKYHHNILGIISDTHFPREGNMDPTAGYDFLKTIKNKAPNLPMMLQSSEESNRKLAKELDVYFLYKLSPTLLEDFRKFSLQYLGFGDFVFLLPKNGELQEIARAQNMQEFEYHLKHVPLDSVVYHAERDDYSKWLMARGEFTLAMKLRPKKVSDFTNLDENRQFLIDVFNETRRRKQRGSITEFSQQQFEFDSSFTRIGGDSLGGKGRGLAFLRKLLARTELDGKYPEMHIIVPNTVVIGTEAFDHFLEENQMRRKLEEKKLTDHQIAQLFLQGKLPKNILDDLKKLLRHFTQPIAIRSSSLLEDSLNYPFAGIYNTYMLPNSHGNDRIRLKQLCDAIKLVYASVFYQNAQSYIEATASKSEEEKMAVVIQEIIGTDHNGQYYPTFSGVAQSYNFYPVSHQRYEDGIVSVAVGLGNTVVGGGQVFRFSPKYPGINPDFSTADMAFENSQRELYVLDTTKKNIVLFEDDDVTLKKIPLTKINTDPALEHVASTYDIDDKILRDGVNGSGPLLMTFSGVLHSKLFPLPGLLEDLLNIGQEGMGCPVEVEFAVDFHGKQGSKPICALLQIRPLVISQESCELLWSEEDTKKDDVLLYSDQALGNGIITTIKDILYVPMEKFSGNISPSIAREVESINEELTREHRPYMLLGPGRWGTQDPWLGIPVTWNQISGVRVLVETSLKDLHIKPSQGTHFFQNMVCRGIGYVSIPDHSPGSFVDWNWLQQQNHLNTLEYVTHVRLDKPLKVRLDGRCGGALVHKPRKNKT